MDPETSTNVNSGHNAKINRTHPTDSSDYKGNRNPNCNPTDAANPINPNPFRSLNWTFAWLTYISSIRRLIGCRLSMTLNRKDNPHQQVRVIREMTFRTFAWQFNHLSTCKAIVDTTLRSSWTNWCHFVRLQSWTARRWNFAIARCITAPMSILSGPATCYHGPLRENTTSSTKQELHNILRGSFDK